MKIRYSRRVRKLDGDAVINFTCDDVGPSVGSFLLTGVPERQVERCRGVAIRWAKEGEEGITKMSEKDLDKLPEYDLTKKK